MITDGESESMFRSKVTIALVALLVLVLIAWLILR
ncbi:hypothetical protein JOC45_001179 [Gordonia hydrophobica]|nr:hypothetical protein [Gordonia hydrophobica]